MYTTFKMNLRGLFPSYLRPHVPNKAKCPNERNHPICESVDCEDLTICFCRRYLSSYCNSRKRLSNAFGLGCLDAEKREEIDP